MNGQQRTVPRNHLSRTSSYCQRNGEQNLKHREVHLINGMLCLCLRIKKGKMVSKGEYLIIIRYSKFHKIMPVGGIHLLHFNCRSVQLFVFVCHHTLSIIPNWSGSCQSKSSILTPATFEIISEFFVCCFLAT